LRLVVQRVSSADVTVEGEVISSIRTGLLILVGAGKGDSPDVARQLAGKVARLRIFPDDDWKMNLSIADVGGEVLAVSQFTLYGDTRKGNRPSFVEAAEPDMAQSLIDEFVAELTRAGVTVKEGIFGAHMKVGLVNDGPVTILLES
jgi:D-tyrosyl-tRNA(Tyr) deacylase